MFLSNYQNYQSVSFITLLNFIGYCVKCYECNVWKAGYGHLCAEPRIRNDCMYCMKLDTQMWTGYYKDTPRCESLHPVI